MNKYEDWVRATAEDLSWGDLRVVEHTRKSIVFYWRDELGEMQCAIVNKRIEDDWQNVSVWLIEEYLQPKVLEAMEFVRVADAWMGAYPRG